LSPLLPAHVAETLRQMGNASHDVARVLDERVPGRGH
jgi:hypothetical protein